MPTDSQVTAWLKGESLSASVTTPGVAWNDAQSLLAKFISPIDLRADAAVEAARTAGILGGPNVKDRIVVKGRRRDLLFKCVEVSYAKLGYIAGTTEGENVVNGTFGSTGTWTAGANGGSLSLSAGRGVVANTAALQGYMIQSFPVVQGQSYRWSAELSIGSGPNPRLRLGTNSGGVQISDNIGAGTPGGTFIAPTSTVFIAIGPNSAVSGATAQFDNISVRPELKRVFVIGVAENDNNTTTLTVIRSLV
jgi:hypothetical protein